MPEILISDIEREITLKEIQWAKKQACENREEMIDILAKKHKIPNEQVSIWLNILGK